ncbi:hypothetical protein ACFXPX_01940 [Kitasatospora sp. NPDC059146]|uniref:hypothetical protein n=1 Tax=Kitasatospora sp. NPDC059146 TaxID=3346741 RepID=UPI003698813E
MYSSVVKSSSSIPSSANTARIAETELPGLMTPELVNLLAPGSTPHATAFQVIGACPALDVVLTSTSTRRHWDDARAALAEPIPDKRLRTVLDVLSAG